VIALETMHAPMLRVTLLVVAAGCYSPNASDCAYACSNNDCPANLTCDRGFCRSASQVGGPQCATGDATENVECPLSYTKVGSGYYRASTDPKYFGAAEIQCAADLLDHTHLAVISSTAELASLSPYLDTATQNYTWIGLSNARSTTFEFQWVTDEPAPVPANGIPPWLPGEPDMPMTEHCVVLQPNTSGYVDTGCTGQTRPYVCECDAYAENPEHF
jgi:hypothetical protein